jgi:YD repeat-containing protein
MSRDIVAVGPTTDCAESLLRLDWTLFHVDGYPLTDTAVLGQPEEQTTVRPLQSVETRDEPHRRTGPRDAVGYDSQAQVSYTYDDADRLTGVTQGSAAVAIAYDDADRRTSLTLPNGIVVEYGYDDDSRLTGITYKDGGTPIGDLTYTYDANGQRTGVGGTWARTTLPAALASASFS